MPIQAIRFENFMAFEDTDWIELRPITLLFGKNSSGKSAITRALRLLNQSLFSPNAQDEILSLETEELDCGSYETVAYRGGSEEFDEEGKPIPKEISFGFRCTINPEMMGLITQIVPEEKLKGLPYIDLLVTVRQVNNPDSNQGNIGGISRNKKIVLSRFFLLLSSKINKKMTILLRAKHVPNWSGALWLRSSVVSIPKGNNVQLGSLSTLLPELRFTEEVGELSCINTLLLLVNSEVREFLNQIEYLGPMRPEPRRIFALDNLLLHRWEKQGLKTWINYLRTGKELDPKISKALERMDLCSDADAESYGYQGQGIMSQLMITDKQSGLRINIRDVGYGMSQVLPVIATCFKCPKDTLLIIEQPELHLHPKAQAEMMSVFTETVNQTLTVGSEDFPKNTRLLIETHSEHILLRMRRSIVETSAGVNWETKGENRMIRPDDVKAYFITNGKVFAIEFDKFGDYKNAHPDFRSFFSDDMNEVLEMTNAKLLAMDLGVKKE